MAYHMLNTRVAKQCGVNAALIFHYLHFWIEKNRANGKHFHDGRYWTYCSMDGFRRILDYLSPKQIRTAIEKLEREGHIVKGSYNKSSYDRTTWYAITEAGYGLLRDTETANPVAVSENSICPDGQMETPESANQSAAEGNSIEEPVIITDIATDIIPPNPPAGGTEGVYPAESVPAGGAEDSGVESVPADETRKTPDAAFDRFWSIYPRKEGKGAARKAFGKARKKVALEAMLSAVELQKQSPQWNRDDGRYIPMPATWLNQERWGDSPNDAGCPRPEQPPGGKRKKTYRELIQERNARKGSEYDGH